MVMVKTKSVKGLRICLLSPRMVMVKTKSVKGLRICLLSPRMVMVKTKSIKLLEKCRTRFGPWIGETMKLAAATLLQK
jgi:hypothetical protein